MHDAGSSGHQLLPRALPVQTALLSPVLAITAKMGNDQSAPRGEDTTYLEQVTHNFNVTFAQAGWFPGRKKNADINSNFITIIGAFTLYIPPFNTPTQLKLRNARISLLVNLALRN